MPAGNGRQPQLDLDDVDAFAEAAHAGQTRHNGAPYIVHPRAVRAILEDEHPEPADALMLAIALLHDVLEDCDVHPTILLERYGRAVQEGVTLLSKQVRALGLERDHHVYWSGLRNGPRHVRLIKTADRLANWRDALAAADEKLVTRYREETLRDLLPLLRDAGETW
ncbi:MAG: HD domain-containing protein, partial [Gemmatimonadota bacterium]